MAVLRFWAPRLGGLGATYDDHLRLIGNRVVDTSYCSVNWIFFAWYYGWRRHIGDFAPTGSVDPKFYPTNHSSSQKTKLNALSYGIKIWTDFFHFVAIHAFDEQTDRQTDRLLEFLSLDRVCIPCNAVKTNVYLLEFYSMQFSWHHIRVSWVNLLINDQYEYAYKRYYSCS